MKAAFLIKNGPSEAAFEIRETEKPQINPSQVLIEVEAFGLNFADVMARLGMYRDAPPMPAVLGYDVVGWVREKGSDIKHVEIGDRVLALSRFGGYAEFTATEAAGVVKIPDSMDAAAATALATQYGTAYYMIDDLTKAHAGDHVLIHAAAGGVGTALVQWAVYKGCIIYGTAGSAAKLEYLKGLGVHHPINYREDDFFEKIKAIRGEAGLDLIFDPVGGKSVKKGMKLLGAGGRLFVFGASSMTTAKNIFQKIAVGLGFGFYHPIGLVGPSKSILGVNMLRIADNRPETLQRVLKQCVHYAEQGVFKPTIGGKYKIDQLAEAHDALEKRKTMGKLAIYWK
ncbi:MAG: zinc-binding dehydrogenase [Bacteroidota bacterium]